MPEINILSPHVADLIAAGEVVERPASVIKELIENSFDAGAKNITIELKNGGMTYIRVTDDGCGMLPEDAGVCFLRHATSKLKNERSLEAIGTMGFRGEALAAISSVSRIEMITRRKGSVEGTRVLVEAGEIAEMSPCGCPVGTTIIVRDLFHNTPARLKFMKSDRAEGSACTAFALRCALGRPEVSVRLIRDGKEEFFSPGDGKISSCAYSLLGREQALDLLEMSAQGEDVSVAGYVGSPKAGHGNRAKQFFFVNGRCIKSALLQAAVEQAYRNTLLTGRYPAAVCYLTLSPASVDVNVHPAKTEVKFRDERRIFDAVYYAALSALTGEKPSAEIKLSHTTAKALSASKKDFFKSTSSCESRGKSPSTEKSAGFSSAPTIIAEKPKIGSSPTAEHISKPQEACQLRLCDSVRPSYSPPARSEEETDKSPRIEPGSEVASVTPADFRLVGETMKTYILVEQGDNLILIDKHAAHERMIFDRLKSQGHEIMSQTLLSPVTTKLSTADIEIIERNGKLLSRLGFEIDPYGDDSVILRGVPADTDVSDAPAMIEEICDKLGRGSRVSEADSVDEILHTVACKAAIKAGWSTAQAELMKIAEAVIRGEVKYCPHGRPVSVTLTKKHLDKEFSRIV